MAPDINYQSKMKEREHIKEILDQSKTQNQLGKLQTLQLHSDVKVFFRSPTPFAFVDSNTRWSHSLLAALLSRYRMALALLTFFKSPRQPKISLTGSHTSLSRSPFCDVPDKHLASVALLSCGGRSHKPVL